MPHVLCPHGKVRARAKRAKTATEFATAEAYRNLIFVTAAREAG
jgi:hypothetical protein